MYRSLEEICKEAAATGCSFWELIQKDDCRERQIAQEESFVQLQRMYQAMKEADQDYDGTLHSRSGLVGTDGGKLEHYVEQEEPICGDFLGRVMEKAVKMGESNACMKRIVAAPTAGACGVVPAVFLSMQEKYHYTDEEMTKALYVASGIGGVIASRAFIAGAQGGCQAEIGSASAMAAGGAVHLRGRLCRGSGARCSDGTEKSAGSGMRSGSRFGRSTLRKTKRIRRGCRPFGGRYGACRSAQQNSS